MTILSRSPSPSEGQASQRLVSFPLISPSSWGSPRRGMVKGRSREGEYLQEDSGVALGRGNIYRKTVGVVWEREG